MPVHSGVRDGGPIDPDVLFTVELKEFSNGELCAVVRDDGVWYSKAMDDVKEEQHGLLGFDHRDQPSFDPFCELVSGGVMAPTSRVRARVQPWPLHEEVVEGFHDAFDHPHELIVCGGRDHALCHKVAYGRRGIAETERKRRRGTPCGAFQREGEAARDLPGRLGSKGDAKPALKPLVAGADGRERLDGETDQRQLSSHHDDEVQVIETHMCVRDPADCVVSHPRPDLERAKAPT